MWMAKFARQRQGFFTMCVRLFRITLIPEHPPHAQHADDPHIIIVVYRPIHLVLMYVVARERKRELFFRLNKLAKPKSVHTQHVMSFDVWNWVGLHVSAISQGKNLFAIRLDLGKGAVCHV